jgi:hypothetical protein
MKAIIHSLSHVLAMLTVLVGSAIGGELSGSLTYMDVHDRAAKAVAVPESGSHELRVITPTLLEVYIVSEREGFAKRPTFCDWVDDEADVIPGAIAVASDLEVTVNGRVTTVSATGFKRHVRFAPIDQSKFVMENFLYIELGTTIGTGVTVAVSSPTTKWPSTFVLSAVMDENRWSPAVHTNQVGYEIGARKTGHVGIWLGTLGEFAVNGSAGFEVINATTNAVAARGSLTARTETGFQYPPASGAPDPYLHVYEADFTSLDTPGLYRLKIPGIGASYPFEIGAGIDGVFARNFAAGLFHQRSGFDHKLPYTRYEDGPGHNALAEIPSNTDRAAYQFMWDWLQSETSGAITGPGELLSPYSSTGTIDVIGGHHDAGDYSKYTTNVSQMVHALTFALDALPGVASLDNLGIPESGDGIADLLQEVKWEADFLAKLQDTDGGFYYAVFPRDRRFDGNVLPSNGDVQIVLPKNIVATAAAVGALADIGSSPAFRAAYGAAVGDDYIAKALSGWGFLAATIDTNNDSNVTAAEIAAGYQKLSAYGDAFGPNDELAYAAAALFAATGNSTFEGFLKQLAPDPSSPELITQGYIQLWEAWGSAFRSYAFATRTGRLATSQVDTAYLALVDAELVSAGDEVVVRSGHSTYGIAIDEKPKQFLNPSYFFGNDASFDALVALQLNPGGSAGYNNAIRYNLNYTAGNNPANAPYLTGIGWAQRREIVSQFSQNDGFVLPPVGIPVGNVQAGMPYIDGYLTSGGGNLLQRSIYPNTGGFIYPVYDVWADTFEVGGETTVPPFARGAAVTAWLFAQTALSSQAWNSATATISGVPAITPVGDSITATLASSIDLTGARITWEGSGIEPCHAGLTFTFAPTRSGDNHVAADILFPDGRRVYGLRRYTAEAISSGNGSGNGGEFAADADTIALYHFNGDYQDASGNGYHLVPAGGTTLISDNLGWMSTPAGQAARFSAVGDLLQSVIPDSSVLSSPGQPLSIEARIYPRAYLGFSVDNVPIAALSQEHDTGYALADQKWGSAPKGPVVGANGSDFVTAAVWAAAAPVNQWSLLRITYDGNSLVECHVNDTLIGSVYDEPNASRTNDWNLLLGNFDGDIDEVRISSVVRTGEPPVGTVRPEVLLTAPRDATGGFDVTATFTESVTGFDAGDVAVTNGSVASVSGSDAIYTISITPGTSGPVGISIVKGAAVDFASASNPSLASNVVSVLYAAPGGADPYTIDGDTTALYHFDDNYNDASGNSYHLAASGSVELSADNTAWMASPAGKVVRFRSLGDSLSVSIPDRAIMPSSGQELSIEARVYPRQYLGCSYGNVPIVSLKQNWNSSFELRDSKWGNPHAPSVSTSNVEVVSKQVWSDNVALNQWYHIQILFHRHPTV